MSEDNKGQVMRNRLRLKFQKSVSIIKEEISENEDEEDSESEDEEKKEDSEEESSNPALNPLH